MEAFRQELSKLGWIEGKNITFEYRFAENKGAERLKELAADLVRLKVDLIVAIAGVSVLAAKSATTTIPIVMTNVGDAVSEGLVAMWRAGVVSRYRAASSQRSMASLIWMGPSPMLGATLLRSRILANQRTQADTDNHVARSNNG